MKDNITSLQDALSAMFKDLNLDEKMAEKRIQEKWEELAGKTVAKYTGEIKLIKGKLYLEVQIAPLRQEILYSKIVLTERINQFLGSHLVNDIIIK